MQKLIAILTTWFATSFSTAVLVCVAVSVRLHLLFDPQEHWQATLGGTLLGATVLLVYTKAYLVPLAGARRVAKAFGYASIPAWGFGVALGLADAAQSGAMLSSSQFGLLGISFLFGILGTLRAVAHFRAFWREVGC